MKDKYKQIKRDLVQRRNQLHKRVQKIRKDVQHIDQPLDKDPEDQAIELENDEVLNQLEPSTRRELKHIMAALERMQEGEYGTCVDCGTEIAIDRLEAIPETMYCFECAEKHESEA